jgi:hypothetical protein
MIAAIAQLDSPASSLCIGGFLGWNPRSIAI